MITVFRLEKDGYGPFSHPEHGWLHQLSPSILFDHFHKHFDRNNEPPGFDVPILNWLISLGRSHQLALNPDLHFGCSSAEDLYKYWSNGFVYEALNFGFIIESYQVYDYCYCSIGLQIAFLLPIPKQSNNKIQEFHFEKVF